MNNIDKSLIDIELILREKDRILKELNEYNKRVDRTIVLYISAVYAAIGLKATGKIDFSNFWENPELTPVIFLFIFLNYCILIHGISQSSWTIALSKFIHVELAEELNRKIHNLGFLIPPYSINSWDDWEIDIKGLAVSTRNTVVGLWILLVIGISIFSLSVLNIWKFYQAHPLVTSIVIMIFFLMQTYINYILMLELYFVKRFHETSKKISKLTILLFITNSVIISLLLITFCFYFVLAIDPIYLL